MRRSQHRRRSSDGLRGATVNARRGDDDRIHGEGGPDGADGRGRGLSRSDASEAAAVAFVSTIATRDAGAAFAALLRLASREAGITLPEWSIAAGFPRDADDDRLRRAIVAAEDAGLRLVDGKGLFTRRHVRDASDETPSHPVPVETSESFLALLSEPEALAADPSAARLDPRTTAWIPLLVAATRAGRRDDVGLHVALRVGRGGERAVLDLASHLAGAGADVLVPTSRRDLAWTIVQAELHAGRGPLVVVMAQARLLEDPDSSDRDWDAPTSTPEALRLCSGAAALLPALAATRNVYVWPTPATGNLPPEAIEVIGAEIGPVSLDRGWVGSALAERLPGLGPGGTSALTRRHPDPRSAGATLAAIRAAVASGCDVAAACALVLGAAPSEDDAPGPPPDFDEALLACRPEAIALLRIGAEALARGGRVLAFGPPGGGKSSYALALAARLGSGAAGTPGRPAISMSPARILARGWGSTERLLHDLWSRAEQEGATLVADEFGTLCPARDGGTGGNSYLVRSLTDEMLRAMDAHPGVPLIATVNDPASIDPSGIRRFTFVLSFGDALSPAQERLAWRRLLRMDPPAAWRPIGAAVADFPVAASRCRALGRGDPASHAEALRDAKVNRTARLGTPPGTPLH